MKETIIDYPELVKQWHPTKNGNSKPEDVPSGSHKKVWWKCDKEQDHEWEANVNSRTSNGRGCPCCDSKKVVKSNCLTTTHPELAKQWHPTKNGNLLPDNVIAGSDKKFWWKCPVADDHEWEAQPNNRTRRGVSCPCCVGRKVVLSNCLSVTHPELAKQWHPTKNGNLTPNNIVGGCNKKVWWKCPVADSHEWETQPNNRVANKNGCPVCCESKGENAIAIILKNKSIQFKREHRFSSCKAKLMLPFDFVFLHNKKVCAIEYQGIQHYKPVNWGGMSTDPIKQFDSTKFRDAIKAKWAKENNMSLLIVPYWKKDNIEQLIDEFLLVT